MSISDDEENMIPETKFSDDKDDNIHISDVDNHIEDAPIENKTKNDNRNEITLCKTDENSEHNNKDIQRKHLVFETPENEKKHQLRNNNRMTKYLTKTRLKRETTAIGGKGFSTSQKTQMQESIQPYGS